MTADAGRDTDSRIPDPGADSGRGTDPSTAGNTNRSTAGSSGRSPDRNTDRSPAGNTARSTDRNTDRDTDQDAVSEVLSALADPTRRRILDAIAAHGEATATVLATELPVSRQAIVKHLAVLTRAGLVAGHREGREARYTVLPARLGVTARWMDRVASEWDNRLSAIKRLAEADPATPRPSGSAPAPPGRPTR